MLSAWAIENNETSDFETLPPDELNTILAESSGQPLEKIQKDTDRDFYMTADEAIKYGLADGIVEKI